MAKPQHPEPEMVQDIFDVVQGKVASRMKGAPVLELPTTDSDSRSEEEIVPPPKITALKSAKVQTIDTPVLHKVTWPCKVIYICTGQPAEYDQLSITLFVSGIPMVIVLEKESVRPYMLQHKT